ncbi:alpha/beta hydrolase [Pseudorhodoplanes sinuspersici]|nr:alpha/beta fold hydrolase [Pseudorhodoplanes sinuspersici]RKE67572.1 alpha/beta hydrolase family protein [Pseudorhodoplanes sinuspersici]
MLQRRSLRLFLLSVCLALAGEANSAPIIPEGDGRQTVELAGKRWTIFTYRPSACSPASLLLLFHGRGGVRHYRGDAHVLADKLCAIVIAPRFQTKTSHYQQGGIVRKGVVQPERKWTVNVVTPLAQWARTQTGIDQYNLIGHSAGAQFLSRVAAFHDDAARRIVIANPSTYVFPSLDVKAPFGLGGVYPDTEAEARLRDYLARPVTIYLGEADTNEEARDLNRSPDAMAQGKTRLERGMKTFEDAQQLAAKQNWPFNWRLVRLPGVGHSARKMFSAPEAIEALRP